MCLYGFAGVGVRGERERESEGQTDLHVAASFYLHTDSVQRLCLLPHPLHAVRHLVLQRIKNMIIFMITILYQPPHRSMCSM